MPTLVTGGTGFIGSNLVKVLVERGHQVISLDIAPPDPIVRRYLGPHFDDVTWLQVDITDRQAVMDIADSHRIDKNTNDATTHLIFMRHSLCTTDNVCHKAEPHAPARARARHRPAGGIHL